jgi:ADP-ribose pyrophosphatase YjhB (NUDIX family)
LFRIISPDISFTQVKYMNTETLLTSIQTGTISDQATLLDTQGDSSPISEMASKIRVLLNRCKKTDAFNNCFFDLSEIPTYTDLPEIPSFTHKQELKEFKAQLPSVLNGQTDKHVIGLKLLQNQSRIVKYALKFGFTFHNANPENMLMTLCLKGHKVADCSYPKYMTVSVGVTGVVFDHQLEKVLLIQEKWGENKKMKPPTGTVDYLEANEDPLCAVVRELHEETNIVVNPKDAVLVGNTWTQNLRGKNPDINFVFAFKVSVDAELKAQEEEISQISWLSVKDYIHESPDETSQPYVMKRIVTAALQAFLHQKEWVYQNLQWSNGKPVTLFCFNPRSQENL